jgi:alpha-glucosidase
VNPGPADLPVYVRGGSILPIAPLTQSTMVSPSGPLTLRVYPGDGCAGDLYQDDGTTYDFRTGVYLRQHFTCRLASDGSLTLSTQSREGSFVPWWKYLRIEVVGWASKSPSADFQGHHIAVEHTALGWAVTLPDDGRSVEVTFH